MVYGRRGRQARRAAGFVPASGCGPKMSRFRVGHVPSHLRGRSTERMIRMGLGSWHVVVLCIYHGIGQYGALNRLHRARPGIFAMSDDSRSTRRARPSGRAIRRYLRQLLRFLGQPAAWVPLFLFVILSGVVRLVASTLSDLDPCAQPGKNYLQDMKIAVYETSGFHEGKCEQTQFRRRQLMDIFCRGHGGAHTYGRKRRREYHHLS